MARMFPVTALAPHTRGPATTAAATTRVRWFTLHVLTRATPAGPMPLPRLSPSLVRPHTTPAAGIRPLPQPVITRIIQAAILAVVPQARLLPSAEVRITTRAEASMAALAVVPIIIRAAVHREALASAEAPMAVIIQAVLLLRLEALRDRATAAVDITAETAMACIDAGKV